MELDVGVLRMKGRQRRDENQAGQRAGHIHPQPPPGRSHGAGEAGVGIFQVRQQAHHPRVIGRAIGGELHASRGAVQQLHARAGFELLHQLRDGGAAHVQGVGGSGEAARFHHAGKGLQGIKTVHGGGGSVQPIVWP